MGCIHSSWKFLILSFLCHYFIWVCLKSFFVQLSQHSCPTSWHRHLKVAKPWYTTFPLTNIMCCLLVQFLWLKIVHFLWLTNVVNLWCYIKIVFFFQPWIPSLYVFFQLLWLVLYLFILYFKGLCKNVVWNVKCSESTSSYSVAFD